MAGLVPAFLSFNSLQNTSLTRDQNIGVKTPCKGTSTFSPSAINHVGVVLGSVARLQFVERNPLSWQQPGLFGDFHGTPLANNSVECNPVLQLAALSGYKTR